jgi:hypothetical protein
VKLVREDDEEKTLVHKNEFNIVIALDHPNVVKAIEIFVND